LLLYVSFFNSKETTVLNFSSNHDLIVVDPYKISINEETKEADLITYNETMQGDAFSKLPFRLPLSYLLNQPHLSFDIYQSTIKESFDLGISDVEPYQGFLEPFLLFIEQYHEFEIYIALQNKVSYERIKEFFNDHRIKYNI